MLLKNIFAYFSERFPPINMALFTILFFTVQAVATFFVLQNSDFEWGWQLLGVLAVISFFFRLRVFDEIKDYDIDLRNHPKRVLQSGKIKKKHLIIISIVGTALEVIWSIFSGIPAVICWGIAVGYSLFMRYEFFISTFLNRYLLLYAVSHMLVMPLIILWVYSAFYPALDILFPFYILAGLSLFSGFSFEIARKIHASNAERPDVDSYSKSIGFIWSILLVLFVLLCGILIQVFLLDLINARLWAYLTVISIYFFALVLYFRNILKPKEKGIRNAEKLVSLFMLASYISIIIEVHFHSP